jgi:hypothetical protein
MGEQYTLSQKSEDRLTNTLDILELNCDLAQKCIASARNALKRVFPHFFPKDVQPEVFAQLAHRFLEGDDPALAYRQASLKIGVEGTIALVAASGQKVDWVQAATPKGLTVEKWKAFVKGAKLYSKKLISFLDPKSWAYASNALSFTLIWARSSSMLSTSFVLAIDIKVSTKNFLSPINIATRASILSSDNLFYSNN